MTDRRPTPPPAPAFGAPLAAARPSQEVLDFLATRRSIPVALIGEPGPSAAELDTLLRVAARAPDHGKLAPWRFQVFEGDARGKAGAVMEAVLREKEPGLPEPRYEMERARFSRAPVVVAVVSRADPRHPKIPEWEQLHSSAAVAMLLTLAAQAAGYAAQWITEWCAYDRDVLARLGIADNERVTGFVYIGAPKEASPERVRPEMTDIVSRWRG